MDKITVVSLLQKSIKELAMITEGVVEMSEYPKAIILLARQKTEEILTYIDRLEEIRSSSSNSVLIVDEKEEPQTLVENYLLETDEEKMEIQIESKSSEVETKNEYSSLPVEQELNEEKLSEKVEEEFEEQTTTFINEQEEISTATTFYTNQEPSKDENVDTELEKDETLTNHTTQLSPQLNGARNGHSSQHTLSDAHINGKVTDIRLAMSIGDRFVFQRNLFNGSGEEMHKVLSHLNNLNSFEEAEQFVRSKYEWNAEDEVVESFYQVLKRRFS